MMLALMRINSLFRHYISSFFFCDNKPCITPNILLSTKDTFCHAFSARPLCRPEKEVSVYISPMHHMSPRHFATQERSACMEEREEAMHDPFALHPHHPHMGCWVAHSSLAGSIDLPTSRQAQKVYPLIFLQSYQNFTSV